MAGALAKVERVLPRAVRARVRAVEASVALGAPAPGATVPSEFVALCSEAARGGRRIWLRYRSDGGDESERMVNPYGVVCWARYWYVVGHCHLRAGLRMFRLDRVLAAELRDGTFTLPPDFDSLAYVVRSIATMPGRWAVEVLLGLPREEAHRRVPPAYGTLEAVPDGTLFRCRFDDLDGLARYLVGLGCPWSSGSPPSYATRCGGWRVKSPPRQRRCDSPALDRGGIPTPQRCWITGNRCAGGQDHALTVSSGRRPAPRAPRPRAA